MYELTNDKDQSVFLVKTKDEIDKKEYWFNWIYAKTRAKVQYANEWRLPTTSELELIYTELHNNNLGRNLGYCVFAMSKLLRLEFLQRQIQKQMNQNRADVWGCSLY